MNLGQIEIKCRESADVDQVLLGHFLRHFQPFQDADITMTADEFLSEAVKAFFAYVAQLTEINQDENDSFEQGLEKLAPITAGLIECVMGNKAKAILLLRQLHEFARKQEAELNNVNPIKMLLDDKLQGLQLLWHIVAAKTAAE